MRLTTLLIVFALAAPAHALEPIPDKLVVLTFDDASKSHVTVAAPLLKKHGFGATFLSPRGSTSRPTMAVESSQFATSPALSIAPSSRRTPGA
jgi:peptidoglycan/xylan/chitin deacetylase (PgdA/CDA1 family)